MVHYSLLLFLHLFIYHILYYTLLNSHPTLMYPRYSSRIIILILILTTTITVWCFLFLFSFHLPFGWKFGFCTICSICLHTVNGCYEVLKVSVYLIFLSLWTYALCGVLLGLLLLQLSLELFIFSLLCFFFVCFCVLLSSSSMVCLNQSDYLIVFLCNQMIKWIWRNDSKFE